MKFRMLRYSVDLDAYIVPERNDSVRTKYLGGSRPSG